MTDPLKTVRTHNVATAQGEKAVKGQKRNNAGGFTFKVDAWEQAKRFLILGSETNFYTPGEKLSKDNAKIIIGLASDVRTAKPLVDLIVDVSTAGRAPKQQPVIFALAIASSHGDDESRAYALSKLPAVLRTGTALFTYATYVEQFRGWGRGLKRAVAQWYTEKDVDKLAYQTVKYQSRDGVTHRDLFRLSHPVSQNEAFHGLGEWILRDDSSNAPRIVEGFVKAHAAATADLPAIVREYGLSWEMLPTEALNETAVWEALLDGNVPLGALIRQLPRLTRIGVLGNPALKSAILDRLTDKSEIERARIHPIAILTALKVYASGKSDRGSSTWSPDGKITGALDKAFYLAFKNVEPADKRTLIGLDVSGSMDGHYDYSSGTARTSVLTPREATAAVALVTVATEPSTHVIGFTGGTGGGYWSRRDYSGDYVNSVTDLDSIVSDSRRLDDIVRSVRKLPMGGTDCALPMLYALEKGLEIDTFVILTDNETWAGNIHPFEALKQYRAKTGIDAKLVVLSTEATKFSIADPSDAGMLDIAGFDSAAPALLADFSRGL